MGRTFKVQGVYPREKSILIDLRGVGCGRQTLSILPTPGNLKYADRLRSQILRDHALGKLNIAEYFPDSKIAQSAKHPVTFREWCADWLELIRPDVEATTHQEYRNALTGYFYPIWGDIPLESLNKEIIAKGLAGITGIKGQPISGKTFNNIVIPLRQVLEKAFEFEKIAQPLASVIGTRSVQRPKPDPLQLFEVELILSKLQERYNPQIVNYFEFAFWTGLRPSELIALEWRHVDFNNRIIRVEQAKVRAKTKGTKTHTVRDVDLPTRAMAALERQKAATFMIGGAVFHNPNTGRGWADTDFLVEKYWKPALKALGIRDRDARQTRHTYATMSLDAGARPGYVAAQLGHSTTEMLHRVYSKWIDGRDNSRERDKLDSFSSNVTGDVTKKLGGL